MKKRVVAIFDVEYGPGQWDKTDIALALESELKFKDAVVWDSATDFFLDVEEIGDGVYIIRES